MQTPPAADPVTIRQGTIFRGPAQSGTQAALEYGALPPEVAASLYPDGASQVQGTFGKAREPLTKGVFVSTAATILFCLAALEIWDALRLLLNFNLRFWTTSGPPAALVAVSGVIFITYLFMSNIAFGQFRSSVPTTQNMCLVFAMHLMLFGLGLVIATMPLQQQVIQVRNSILLDCAYSQPARGLRQEYLGLLNVRLQPSCVNQSSVVDCEGYRETPHTSYLQAVERQFSCAGFCLPSFGNATAAGGASPPLHAAYPPMLFQVGTGDHTKTSCDTMITVDLSETVDNISRQNWYVGIILLFVAMGTGLSYWASPLSKI